MKRLIAALAFCASPLYAQEATATFGSGPTELVFRSTTDMAIFGPVIESFVTSNPDLSVVYEQWGSNDLYDQSLSDCAAGSAPADAILSSAVHQLVDLVNSNCAHSYRSELTAQLPETRRWRDELWGLTEEPAVIIYNNDLVDPEDVPKSRFEFLDLMRQNPNDYLGRIATYDIEASGLGYLFAFSDSTEATTFGAMLEGFARSGAVATCCSARIIRAVSDGEFLIAYNVLGSYVQNANIPNVGVVLPEDYTLFLSRGYMIPKQARHTVAAQRLLDFLLSNTGQRVISRMGLIYPDDPAENGLLPSAKRFIPLSLPLLVAVDQHAKERFIDYWRDTFAALLFLP